ncbi:hypothetical protein BDZ90DRAFT_231641 [Jaminaea rosea]|uniref:FAD-binding FR-type domain-containing protein n=1 Tax=Jaminaea rosea TaxID=1569628 RepID=A0A316UTQ4_9BASI|nr:hypothetical protein BDZ90DRAFT_231641 [Jaminaea rosea]PWN28676.1 hypothetical protein BDZ90DRAFT_231641 [Jaminaea rosea]
MSLAALNPRHIQNFSDAATLEPHWGYAMRALPCKNDAGSCEYLDVVYHAHDVGMLYVGILWASIAGVLLLWAVWRQSSRSSTGGPAYGRLADDEDGTRPIPSQRRPLLSPLITFTRRHLLQRNPLPSIFGNASRLQLLILAVLLGYLTLFTFLGITYKTWTTPVKAQPGLYQTRSSLGPWSDRLGVLAFALLPFSILLASRESVLSLVTGVPYQHFNFLHRWLGHVIFAQSLLHTIGWCIVELRLYQPQPSVGSAWVKQKYIIYGLVAMGLLLVLWVSALPFVIRRTGYEVFRKAHYLLAMLFIGGCWGHWKQLECFLIPSLVLWLLDRAVRLVRTGMIHYYHRDAASGEKGLVTPPTFGFSTFKAHARIFENEVDSAIVRLDLHHSNPAAAWLPGQHFFLTFPECSLWQSHPFTPVCQPYTEAGSGSQSYVFRAKRGETKKVASLVRGRKGRVGEKDERGKVIKDERVAVILSGPYGQSVVEDDGNGEHDVLCVAGGTGITFVLPVLLHHLAHDAEDGRRLVLVWVVRHRSDARWLEGEVQALRDSKRVEVKLFVTRDDHAADAVEKGSASASSSSSASRAEGRPDLASLVSSVTSTSRPTRVYGSGPAGMLNDLRDAVAGCEGPKEVKLVCDDRLEW